MATLQAINLTAGDAALRDRFLAAAAKAGIPDYERWVIDRMRQLAVSPVDATGADTIADVYIFAANRQREFLASNTLALWSGEVMLPPGENPGAVTDTHLEYAIANLRQQETP